RFAGDIKKHSLRREIIALGLTNAVLNRGGPAMAVRLAEETQRTTADVAHAFLAAREVFELPTLWQRIDALDGKTKGLAQLALYQATQDLVNAQTLWFLRDGSAMSNLAGTIVRHRAGIDALKPALANVLPDRRRALLETEARQLVAAGQLADLAEAKSVAPSASATRGRAAGRAKSAASGSPPARRHARQPRS